LVPHLRRATNTATLAAALAVLAGCMGVPATSLDQTAAKPVVQPRMDLDSFAYDQPTGSTTMRLPGGTSSAVPTTVVGDGRMVASTSSAGDIKSDGKASVVLNLSGVPLQQAAKTVLGDLIGVNYVVDPRVDGNISVQTTHPVTKSDALEIFQTALNPIGATLSVNRGVYRIGPMDQGATGAVSIPDNPETYSAGSNVRVVPLKYVAATEVARVLEPMVPKGAIVQADDARSIIAVKGSPAELDNMLSSIAIFDVDVMRGMSFAVVPVKTTQPEKLADELKVVFASSKEGPLKGRVNFIPNSRLGAILVVTSQPNYLPRAQAWIKRLDARASGTDPRAHVYAVQNRSARELARILQRMFADEMKSNSAAGSDVSPRSKPVTLASTSANGDSGNSPFGAPRAASGSAGVFRNSGGDTSQDPRGSARTADLEQEDPVVDAGAGGPSKEPRLRVVADEPKNSLIIMANDRDYERVFRLLQTLDVVPNQVMIEAAIAEVTLTDDLRFGVEWKLKSGSSAASFTSLLANGLDAALPGFNYAFKAANIAGTLTALQGIADVNVISTPSLMVMDNRTAMLQIGDQVPITTQTAANTATSNVAIVNSITMRDTGVILAVTPRVNESGRVQLDIEQEVSAVVKTTSSNIDSPTIQQRRVRTTVVVNDGEVLALGGMIQDQVSKTSSHIPILGDIPGIGAAFSTRGSEKRKTELIILITPRVVRDRAESRLVTEEYRRKIHVYMPHGVTARRGPKDAIKRIVRP
jgi:general secretion pathway protein D